MPYYPPASGGVDTQDEGVPLGNTSSLNFTGAGVTASGVNPTVVNIPGGAGSFAIYSATISNVPYGSQYYEATVVDASITPASKLMVGWGSLVDPDENEPAMDDVFFDAIAGTGSMVVRMSAQENTSRLGGSYKVNYLLG